MQKRLDIKYNIPSIKVFLDIFNLTLEEKEEYEINCSLGIYMNDIEVGKVFFKEETIEINTQSMYGILNGQMDYAIAFGLTDLERFNTIGQLGRHINYQNNINFSLKYSNGNVFQGNLVFHTILDNEFGNKINPHFILNYQDGDKKYCIKFQEDGFPFQFIEKRGNFKETIEYELFNSFGPYMLHSKSDKFSDGINTYDYYELRCISKSYDNKDMNTAVVHKKFHESCIVHNYKEFSKVSKDDCLSEEIKNKANFFKLIDPSVEDRIEKLILEFSVDGISFLEKIFIYGFTNYSAEEVYSLFSIEKDDVSLNRFYFDEKTEKFLVYKIFE